MIPSNPRKCHNLKAWDAAVFDAKRLCAAVRRRECRAYQDCDGWDNYNTASQRWTVNGPAPTIGTAYRRFAPPPGLPGQGIYLPATTYLTRNLTSSQQTLILKAAFYPLAYPGSGGAVTIMAVSSSFNTALTFNGLGQLQLWAAFPSGGQVLRYSGPTGIITPLNWYAIEWLITISPTVGVLQVWVNGVEVINVAGINTDTGTSNASQIHLADGNNPGCYFDDYRCWDNTGSIPNTPLGTDSRMVTKMMNGAGSFAQWTPNGAAANWQCTDDNPPDDDSTYVSGSSAGLIDSYAAPSAGFTAAPAMVVSRIRARKDDSATRTVQFGVISGSSANTSGVATVGSTYQFYDGCSPYDPATTLPWTAAAADAAGHYKQETA